MEIQQAQRRTFENTQQSNFLLDLLESNRIFDITIIITWFGLITIIGLSYLLYDSAAFIHLCILGVLMLGLSVSLTIYRCCCLGGSEESEEKQMKERESSSDGSSSEESQEQINKSGEKEE